jgi:putative Mn2+ efflux pump MntP
LCFSFGFEAFFIAPAGVYIGHIFGNKYQQKAQITGGIILILIGVKILIEGLGII